MFILFHSIFAFTVEKIDVTCESSLILSLCTAVTQSTIAVEKEEESAPLTCTSAVGSGKSQSFIPLGKKDDAHCCQRSDYMSITNFQKNNSAMTQNLKES